MTGDADPDLLAWIVLSRVHDGGVTRQHGDYFDRDVLTPDYLAEPFAQLTDAGSLALADPDPTGRQQVTITDAGHSRYTQLRDAARNH
ncbi:MAG: hypothetical protein M3Y48_15830 [Actinomycetota bacterium]|nr:hypothetical protein [Actinomycetota bacterium]